MDGKSLIVGASGQVGTQMLRVLGAENCVATSRVPQAGWAVLDLADLATGEQAESVLSAHALDAIYCVGGMTYVDGCEREPELAHRINARGPGVLAGYALQHDLPFVYFSTEYIFDGSQVHPGPYDEQSPPRPLSVYGASKLQGEHLVLAANSHALVLRTTVVYGPDPREKNFLYTLMKNLASGVAMQVAEDQISTPTYNRDLIATCLGLVTAKASGIFHVCGPELLDRLAFATQVAEALGLDASLLHGASTASLSQTAPRPLAAGLATAKLLELYPQLKMRTVAESLNDCVAELRQFVESFHCAPVS